MVLTLLFTIIPTLFAYILWSSSQITIKSNFLKIPLYWFTGQFVLATSTFLLANLLSLFADNLLQRSSLIILILLSDVVILQYKVFLTFAKKLLPLKPSIHLGSILLVIACFLFSEHLFSRQLVEMNGIIFRSPIYWDFDWHSALIQNFVLGDNFPPQNEAFAGVPHVYHYFWAILTGIYAATSLGLVKAINFYSAISFFFILISLVGISEEIFRKKIIGIIAIMLAITSSSFHIVDYILMHLHENFLAQIKYIFLTNRSPWETSFLPDKLYGYNGTMFNIFYFIVERQIIFGVLFLILSVWFLYKRDEIKNWMLFIVGIGMGTFFMWHLYITIILLCSLFCLLVTDGNRKKTGILLSGFLISFLPLLIYFKALTFSPWFTEAMRSFPIFNPGFSAQEGKPFSLFFAVFYYVYAYGFKIFILIIGFIILFIKKRKMFFIAFSIILPAFILLNTIQLAPPTIYENHKFLRPMNMVIDIVAAYSLYIIFFQKRKKLIKAIGFVVFISLITSGIIELMPFLNSKPTQVHSAYPSKVTSLLLENTSPSDTFVGQDDVQIQLAGRKMFLGNMLAGGVGHDTDRRSQIIYAIYNAPTHNAFCKLVRENNIDYVEYKTGDWEKPSYLNGFPALFISDNSGEKIFFVSSKKGCEK